MDKGKCMCECAGADKCMDALMKQTRMLNNNKTSKTFVCDMHSQNFIMSAYVPTKHTANSPVYLTPTAKQTRVTKEQKMHSHGLTKQRHNKTSKR